MKTQLVVGGVYVYEGPSGSGKCSLYDPIRNDFVSIDDLLLTYLGLETPRENGSTFLSFLSPSGVHLLVVNEVWDRVFVRVA